MTSPRFVPFPGLPSYSEEETLARAEAFNVQLQSRRTLREFDSRPVPREVIETCLLAAGSAPSGAHQQPWQFVLIGDPALKSRIRAAAEAEEKAFYQHRAPDDWLEALGPLGTDEHKPFLEAAPWLIAIFLKRYRRRADGSKTKHYYTAESVGIATGFLIAALHHCGLSTLTHTPSPMGFLNEILGRPKETERPFLLLVVGYARPGAMVPDLERKSLQDIATFF